MYKIEGSVSIFASYLFNNYTKISSQIPWKKAKIVQKLNVFTYFSENTIIFGLKWSTDRKYCKFTSKNSVSGGQQVGVKRAGISSPCYAMDPSFTIVYLRYNSQIYWSKSQRLWSKSSNPRRFSLS